MIATSALIASASSIAISIAIKAVRHRLVKSGSDGLASLLFKSKAKDAPSPGQGGSPRRQAPQRPFSQAPDVFVVASPQDLAAVAAKVGAVPAADLAESHLIVGLRSAPSSRHGYQAVRLSDGKSPQQAVLTSDPEEIAAILRMGLVVVFSKTTLKDLDTILRGMGHEGMRVAGERLAPLPEASDVEGCSLVLHTGPALFALGRAAAGALPRAAVQNEAAKAEARDFTGAIDSAGGREFQKPKPAPQPSSVHDDLHPRREGRMQAPPAGPAASSPRPSAPFAMTQGEILQAAAERGRARQRLAAMTEKERVEEAVRVRLEEESLAAEERRRKAEAAQAAQAAQAAKAAPVREDASSILDRLAEE